MAWRGDRVKKLRLQKSWTQEYLAELVGVNQRMMPRYEKTNNESVEPNAEIVANFARALEVTSDYLLGLSDEPKERFVERELSQEEERLIMAIRSGKPVQATQEFASLLKSME